jgi:CheY-like chemotaxis protein
MVRRILVVDDNRDAADSLRTLLEICHYTARAVYDGQSGLEVARSWAPDAVVSDIGMPGLNGYEFARCLAPAHRFLLIAYSGYGEEAYRLEAFDAGFDFYFSKSDDTDLILRALRTSFADPIASIQTHDRVRWVTCCLCGAAWKEQFVSAGLEAYGTLTGPLCPRCLNQPPRTAGDVFRSLFFSERLPAREDVVVRTALVLEEAKRLRTISQHIRAASDVLLRHCCASRRRRAPFEDLTVLFGQLSRMPRWQIRVEDVMAVERNRYRHRFHGDEREVRRAVDERYQAFLAPNPEPALFDM